jgi:hypothetical protein
MAPEGRPTRRAPLWFVVIELLIDDSARQMPSATIIFAAIPAKSVRIVRVGFMVVPFVFRDWCSKSVLYFTLSDTPSM